MLDEFLQYLGGASVISRLARPVIRSEKCMGCHVHQAVFQGADFPGPLEARTLDETHVKKMSVIEVIQSVIHLPAFPVIRCNFAL